MYLVYHIYVLTLEPTSGPASGNLFNLVICRRDKINRLTQNNLLGTP